MKLHVPALAAAGLLLFAGHALTAENTITDQEEHFLRGYFDRQSNAVQLARVALERGSADTRQFAQSELDMYASFADGIKKLYDEFKLNTRPLAPGETSPKLGFGLSRGLDPLPEGYAWASRNVGSFLNQGSAATPGMPAAGGMPQSNAAPPAGAAPASAPRAGGAGARAGGPMQNRYDYDLAAMRQLSGTEFDRAYALRVAVAHNAMLRHISNELTTDGNNPSMIAFARSAFKVIAAQNQKIESLAAGNGLPAPRGGGAPPPAT